VRVIGIDPAPVKGLSVYDGEDREIRLEESAAFIAQLAGEDDCLVCWDAPLTGPPSSVVAGAKARGAAFSQRPIESFFSRASTGFKTPRGISVRGYSGCPHWAISRALLGLPRVGPHDAPLDSLPFVLCTQDGQRQIAGRRVVEVHPAVALWLWCRDGRGPSASWDYKHSPTILIELWRLLLEVPHQARLLGSVDAPKSDDELDARLAFVLGRLWLEGSESVMLLGDADNGALLVPRVSGIADAFQSFISGNRLLCQRRRQRASGQARPSEGSTSLAQVNV
jgi:hypothetical protein